MAEIPEDQQHIHADLAVIGEELHRVVGLLATYPPEVAAVVAAAALKPVLGAQARRRLVGLIVTEVRALQVRRLQEGALSPRAAA